MIHLSYIIIYILHISTITSILYMLLDPLINRRRLANRRGPRKKVLMVTTLASSPSWPHGIWHRKFGDTHC